MGDPKMDPLLEVPDEAGAIVAIHPTRPAAVPEGVLDDMPIPMLEYMFDSTRMLVPMDGAEGTDPAVMMEFEGLTDAQKEKILYRNAAKLLAFEA